MLNIKYIFAITLLSFSSCSNESFWTQRQLNTLASFQLSNLDDSISNSSNQYADNQQAASFGKRIFFDKRFSLNGALSCASCHQPDKGFY